MQTYQVSFTQGTFFLKEIQILFQKFSKLSEKEIFKTPLDDWIIKQRFLLKTTQK